MVVDGFLISLLCGSGVILFTGGAVIAWLLGSHDRKRLEALELDCKVYQSELGQAQKLATQLTAKLAKFGPKDRDEHGHFVKADSTSLC